MASQCRIEVDVDLDNDDDKQEPLIEVDRDSGSDHSSDDEVGASINKKPTMKEKFDDFNKPQMSLNDSAALE